jgi:SAM-dependent methyltransferase
MTQHLPKRALKALIPERFHDSLRLAGYRFAHYGTERYCLCCNSRVRRFAPYGEAPRPEALCPVCGALERHRLVSLFLRRNMTRLMNPGPLLHVAPEPGIERQLRSLPGADYISTDLERPEVTTRADITALPFAGESLGGLYCSHVLEHVADDRQAMQEFHRVLRPGGWAILQVPIGREKTFEDPSIEDPTLRRKLFGQCDHVRVYGRDFPDRLRGAGFGVTVMRPARAMPDGAAERLGVNTDEEVYLCARAA